MSSGPPAREQPGCLGFLFALFPGLAPQRTDLSASPDALHTAPLPYRSRDYLLTKAERSFFGVLEHIARDDYLLFAKVRLADLLWLPKGTGSRQAHLNRISAKHIDFIICHRDTVRPLLAIELDDSSHQRQSRRDRDDFVDRALADAGLPLLRVPAQPAYNVEDLRAKIIAAIG